VLQCVALCVYIHLYSCGQITLDPSDFGSRKKVEFCSYSEWKLPSFAVSVEYLLFLYIYIYMFL